MTRRRAVYACDIGSTRGKEPSFAWVRLDPTVTNNPITAYTDIEKLIERIRQDADAEHDIALGFEAPLFIPIPHQAANLSKGRLGEGKYPFSSHIGLAVTTLAIHQSAWILMKLRAFVSSRYKFTTDIDAWVSNNSSPILFCWEAFVSGTAHSKSRSNPHGKDAANAAVYFCQKENNLLSVDLVSAENPFSLIGAAAIWSGWTNDIAWLHKQVLVIKPTHPLPNEIKVLIR